MGVPLNFNLFVTLVSNFNLKNELVFLVGPMPFFRIAWTCFGLFETEFIFMILLLLPLITLQPNNITQPIFTQKRYRSKKEKTSTIKFTNLHYTHSNLKPRLNPMATDPRQQPPMPATSNPRQPQTQTSNTTSNPHPHPHPQQHQTQTKMHY